MMWFCKESLVGDMFASALVASKNRLCRPLFTSQQSWSYNYNLHTNLTVTTIKLVSKVNELPSCLKASWKWTHSSISFISFLWDFLKKDLTNTSCKAVKTDESITSLDHYPWWLWGHHSHSAQDDCKCITHTLLIIHRLNANCTRPKG